VLFVYFETSVLSRSIGHSPPYSFLYRDLVCVTVSIDLVCVTVSIDLVCVTVSIDLVCVTVSIDLQSFPSDPSFVLRGN
jgi:hypothetical protein